MSSDAETAPRPLTGGAVMASVSRVAVAATGAAATILVARVLGPGGAGDFAVAQSLIMMLTVGTTLGVEHGVNYYVSSGRWAARDAYRSAQRVALVSGLAGAAIGLLARLLVPSAFGGLSVGVTAMAAFSLPFALSWFYFTYVALAADHYEAYMLPPAAQSTLALVLVAALAFPFGTAGAVAGFALAHVVTAAAFALVARRLLGLAGAPPAERAPGRLRRAIRFGIKGYAANALQFLNVRVDLFVLAAVASAADVGHYAVAVSVTSVMWLLPQALSDVLFPRVAALSARRGPAGAEARAFVEAKTLRHTTLVVVVAGLVLAAALELLVVPVYGPDFRPAIDLGLILLPGVALFGLAGPLSATIVGRGHPGYLLATTLVATPLTLALYATLIPALDATGAALASTISYAASFLLSAAFYRRVTGARVRDRLVPTRSELADYRALPPAIAGWARNARGRLRSGA